jgi:uroporphyrin-III C-methyltransferase
MLDMPSVVPNVLTVGFPPLVPLVGAGAGDAGYLTLAALDVLRRADIVFADDLVDSSVIALIPPHVDVRRVGKRAGKPSADQNDIHAQLIAAARSGKNVVRLKGGDPFIFGRGGEEVDALREAGLDVAVVPGLTAALVAAAATAIPLTDRRLATQVTFITATDRDGETPDIKHLVGEGRTLVIYMGGGKAAELSGQLQAHADLLRLPAAIIEDAGRTKQKLRIATAGSLPQEKSNKPTLIIIGKVVDLAVRHG